MAPRLIAICVHLFIILSQFNVLTGFSAAVVGNHGNSPNSWETMVLASSQTLQQFKSSNVATLTSEVNTLGQELMKVNTTANVNRKFLFSLKQID
jgi:hypothetical protein